MHRLVFLLSLVLAAGPTATVDASRGAPIPLDDLLTYRITWLGLHCGDMSLESRGEPSRPALVHLEMRIRSTPWFDAIYRVRSVVTSLYDRNRATTRRYHEISLEKDELKDDLWVVQVDRERARRRKNGAVEIVEIPSSGALDPLAMLYRIRALVDAPGEEYSLTVMTSRGALEATVVAHGWEQIERSSGAVPALRVVQQAVGDSEFGRGGAMTMWLSAGDRRVPYRIEFDLPFGELVATLYDEAAAPILEVDPVPSGE
ncbi:MAG: DUF3108 domain-containing protein, partial [Thermoanaerobaculia bacterium]|nr:DUF3108 domain-containing protein [Thermoanaerobaculia bacterium]